MNKICTSIEQSLKLIELGIDVNTADMYYQNRVGSINYPLPIEYKRGLPLLSQEIAAWSLTALLDVLIYPYIEQNYRGQWVCRVEQQDTTYLWKDSNPVDACYEMVLKLNELNLL